MTFLLDASVSRYWWPLTIRDFVWEIKYWDLRTQNNVKSNLSFNEINKKDLPAIYSTVFRCLLFVLLFFLGVYCITTVTPFIRRMKSRLVTSIWQGHGPVATKMPLFCRNLQVCCKFFRLQPKRETSFSSLRDRLKKSFIISPSYWTICAGLRGTSGFRPVPVTNVALACVAGGIVWVRD